MQLCAIDGGNLRNAIPREAWAVVAVPADCKEAMRVDLNIYQSVIESELAAADPAVEITQSGFLMDFMDICTRMDTLVITNWRISPVVAVGHICVESSWKQSRINGIKMHQEPLQKSGEITATNCFI